MYISSQKTKSLFETLCFIVVFITFACIFKTIMKKRIKVGFWELVARIVLKNRIAILISILALTIFLSLQWKNLGMTYNEANLLPKDHIVNQQYDAFLDKFGEEGNLIVIGFKDNRFFTPKAFQAWNELMTGLKNSKEVELVVSLNDLKKLQKNEVEEKFQLVPLIDNSQTNNAGYLEQIKNELFNKLPFYEGLLFNKQSGSIRSAIYLNKKIVNTAARKTFILENLVPKINRFEKATGIDLRVSGMPYIRTINAENMKGEIGLFIGAALLITSLIFFAPREPPVTSKVNESGSSPKKVRAATLSCFEARASISLRSGMPTNRAFRSGVDLNATPIAFAKPAPSLFAIPGRAFAS